MNDMKLTLGQEMDAPELGAVPTLTLDAVEEPKPEAAAEPVVVNEPILTPEEQKVVDEFVEKIDISNSAVVMQYGSGAHEGSRRSRRADLRSRCGAEGLRYR